MARLGRARPPRAYLILPKALRSAAVQGDLAGVLASANDASNQIQVFAGVATASVTAQPIVNGASRIERKFRLALVAAESRRTKLVKRAVY